MNKLFLNSSLQKQIFPDNSILGIRKSAKRQLCEQKKNYIMEETYESDNNKIKYGKLKLLSCEQGAQGRGLLPCVPGCKRPTVAL